MKKLNILVIGSEVSDFLCPLYKKMQEHYPFEIELIEPRKEWKNQELIDASFAAHHKIRFDLKLFSKAEMLKAAMNPGFWKYFFQNLNIKEAIRSVLVNKQLSPLVQKADVVCFHNLSNHILWLLRFIPAHKKLVLSFWGSDLFLNNINYTYSIQSKALERASHIIVHTPEMRLIALSKFGWHLDQKITAVLSTDFSEALKTYVLNSNHSGAYLSAFKAKHQIPEKNTVVVIGHSAHELDNHMLIIPQLAELDDAVKNACSFVFPMTYGNVGNYLSEVKAACQKHQINFIILDEFMSKQEAEQLKFASEILVRLSKCDAFSLSLCETLAAGNCVISASWLPYGNLRVFDVFYKEINDFNLLSTVLTDMIVQKENYRQRCAGNGNKILQFYEAQNSMHRLANIYRA